MYNYNPNLNPQGRLIDPKKSFGSVMRGISFDADFDNSNIEYLEFWLLDPFADVRVLKINDVLFGVAMSATRLPSVAGVISLSMVADEKL